MTAMNRAGAETMLMNLLRMIDRNSVQFDFAVTAEGRCDYDEEILSLGGKIIHYPKYTGKNHLAYQKWWNVFFQAHPEYRIVHGHIGSTASIYLKIAKQYGRFTIAHSHSTGGKANIHDWLYKIMSFNTRYIADFFIGCSAEAIVSRYGKKIAAQTEKCCILKNGIDTEQYAFSEEKSRSVRNALGLGQDALVIGTAGRFSEAKNPFFMVDILAELKTRKPDFRFLWAGTGELKDKAEAYIASRDLQENILLLGVRDDIPALLQALNVFILPSRFEGLPVIGVEAQAAGVPFLCSDRVSRELNISKCVTFLPITEPRLWADSIMRESIFRRVPNALSDVVKAGYDVRETARWLTALYEKKVCEKTGVNS
ncbi:MAG: glycosyltransferase [Clostridia bacterium]|nr:glycosyltransferase [Clostridia bacterium]